MRDWVFDTRSQSSTSSFPLPVSALGCSEVTQPRWTREQLLSTYPLLSLAFHRSCSCLQSEFIDYTTSPAMEPRTNSPSSSESDTILIPSPTSPRRDDEFYCRDIIFQVPPSQLH